MVGKEDGSGSWGEYQASSTNNSPKKFFRSSSWSASRTMPINPEVSVRNSIDLGGNLGNNGGQPPKFPGLLTPRGPNTKAKSCLPPLAISRRSLDEWPKPGSDDIGEWPGPPTPCGRNVSKGREGLKVDLSAIETNSEKSSGLLKRDKIAYFDKKCSKVAEHIYLGGDAVARDRDILKRNGITHVLNCVGFVCPEYFKADFVYRTLWLQDKPSEDIISILYDVFDYFEDVREQHGKVFVHCCQGVSRSTSLVIAYRMWREGQSFDDAFEFVKSARGIADPNMGFACQLIQCQKRVHAVPLSPSSLLRVYRMAPHSPYDPLHLVPKRLINPSPEGLDSRGAFIVHIPSAIYIWIGKRCDVIMERDARGAVCQILRYERVNVPVHVVSEGNEPLFFWNAFSDYKTDISKDEDRCTTAAAAIQSNERKVGLYDVDFEVFRKAIMGGFVPAFASSEAEHETHLPARENSWSMLRRKFASGRMKEFLSAPKLHVNELQPASHLDNGRDDPAGKHSRSSDASSMLSSTTSSSASSPSWLSSSSSSSSSSPSPPYLSPDSISSDSTGSSNSSSDSSLDSPSAFSSTLSTFSKLSLVPSKTSGNQTNHPGYIEVNFPSQAAANTSSSTKKPSLSIAERRGSLSKCLKLPVMGDCMRTKDNSVGYIGNQKDKSCIVFELGKRKGLADSKDSARNGDGNCRAVGVSAGSRYSCDKVDGQQSPIWKKNSTDCGPNRPLVYSLSSLEKISAFATCSLDSKSAYVIVAPESVSGSSEERNMYFWVGRSYTYGKHHYVADTGGEIGETVDSIDWKKICSEVALHMGLPNGLNMKVVREGEEPEEFLKVLSML